MNAATIMVLGLALLAPGAVWAQPPVTSPEQLASTRELFYLHGHGGHRSAGSMPYAAFGAELACADTATLGERVFHYPLTVPTHLFLERVQVWAFDRDNGDRLRVRVLSVCQTNGGIAAPVANTFATAQSPPGVFGPVLLDLAVGVFPDTNFCALTVEVRMASNGSPCDDRDRTVMRVRAQAFNPEHIFRAGFVARADTTPVAMSGPVQR
jgi:hypothetical protein